MVIDNANLSTLSYLQTLVQNFVNVLDREAVIAEADRLLSDDNVTAINDLIGNALEQIDAGITPAP